MGIQQEIDMLQEGVESKVKVYRRHLEIATKIPLGKILPDYSVKYTLTHAIYQNGKEYKVKQDVQLDYLKVSKQGWE